MAAARFQKDERTKKRRSKPDTRLYQPSRDSAAYDYDRETGEPIPDTDGRVRPVPIRTQKEMSVLERIGVMFCAFAFAGMILFTLSGYERISRAYSDINTLNEDIEEVTLHISELNVAIECAVTIQQAEQAALAAGMTYPTQSQSLVAGDPIPASFGAASGSDTPAGTDPTAEDGAGGADDTGDATGNDPTPTGGDGGGE